MKNGFILILLTLITSVSFCQSEYGTILTIDGADISSEEFLRVFNKNSNLTSEEDKKNLDEYLELFINYKLKVVEAEHLGYDTVQAFTDEFNGYKKQLAKPYLENNEIKNDLVAEAYERYKLEVDASHILISCDENALPADTLKAYEKITAIHARVAGGEPFDQVARATSDDPSVKNNDGKLGYFSSFRMVYPFETAAFTTPVGSVSGIIRTSYGYHIVKVHDRRPNRGSIKAAHIATRIASNATEPEIQAAKEKIDKAYLALMNGMTWEEAVQEFSENPRTKTKNGEIGWLSSGKAPEEFFGPAVKLNAGEFTKPIRTEGSFHIGYVLDKKPIDSFEESKEKLERQVDRDRDRKKALKDQQYSELKEKYEYKENPSELGKLVSLMDSSIYTNDWNAENAAILSDPLITIDEKVITLYDYAKYLAGSEVRKNKRTPIEGIVVFNFEPFANKRLTDYAMKRLPEENDDYKYLLQEYRDGILLFNLTNDLVWQKAQEDTNGLENFYTEADKYNWNERIDVKVYSYTDNAITAQLPALIKKQVKKNKPDSFIIESLCENDSIPCVSVTDKTYEKGHDSMADKLTWEKGSYISESDTENNYIYYVTDIKASEPKKLDEARGLYIADYQTYLEKKWIEELRAKYEVIKHEDVINKVKAGL